MTDQVYNLVRQNVKEAIEGHGIDETRVPVVFVRNGEVFANSRDVAAIFEKRHDNVIRDITVLIAQEPSLGRREHAAERPLNFEETFQTIEIPNGGKREVRSFNMTRDGFVLLAMGFTGSKALKWKLRYIEAFNTMEAELRGRSSTPAVPRSLSEALRLAADQAEQIERQSHEIELLAPKAEAFGRIAEARGSLCITDAAKALQMKRDDLFRWLHANSWIYRRLGNKNWLGYESKRKLGYVEHKVETVPDGQGGEKIAEHVRITAKGLTKLAEIFGVDPIHGSMH